MVATPGTPNEALLRFRPDTGPRQRLQVATARQHPGKLHLGLLAHLLNEEIAPGSTILDPMAGTGSLLYATLDPWACNVVLNELVPQWVAATQASWDRLTHLGFDRPLGWACILEGDARTLPQRWPQNLPPIDAIVMSPPYENALSHKRHGEDYHPQRHKRAGKSEHMIAQRRGYDPPGTRVPGQIGHLTGARYQEAMAEVYAACVPVLAPGGTCIVVLKNVIRRRVERDLIGKARAQLTALGLVYERTLWRHLPNLGGFTNIRRANDPSTPVITCEAAIVLRKPEVPL